MYGSPLDSFVNDLRDKLNSATSIKEQLIEAKYDLQGSLEEVEVYVDEVEGLINALEDVPVVAINFSINVDFDSDG